MGLCCCRTSEPLTKREIKIGCFGIDGAGKTTVLKIIKGENPQGVLSTNGFSMVDMEYNAEFHIKVYDLGGHERIRDIWTNYYAEVHGLLFVVDISNESRLEENYRVIRGLQEHKDTAQKPFLVILNNKTNGEMDDFDFSNSASLHTIGNAQKQMIYMTHLHKYTGFLDKAQHPPLPVATRTKKMDSTLLTQFCVFVDKIIEHYVFLSEGVHAAEMALRMRQQIDKEARRLRLMQEIHNYRPTDVEQVEGNTTEAPNGHISKVTTNDDRSLPKPPRTNVPPKSEANHSKTKNKIVPLTEDTSRYRLRMTRIHQGLKRNEAIKLQSLP